MKPAFCGNCTEPRPDLIRRPIGRDDNPIWVCAQCDPGERAAPVKGRPRGSVDHCKVCGEAGHRAIRGACSPVMRAAQLVRELKLPASLVARSLGITKAAVNRRIARAAGRWTPKIDEHW